MALNLLAEGDLEGEAAPPPAVDLCARPVFGQDVFHDAEPQPAGGRVSVPLHATFRTSAIGSGEARSIVLNDDPSLLACAFNADVDPGPRPFPGIVEKIAHDLAEVMGIHV